MNVLSAPIRKRLLLVLLWVLLPVAASGQDAILLSTVEEIAADFVAVPCHNDDRLEGVRSLFLKYGAPPEAIAVESFRNADNLVVTYKGRSDETIVLGAHYDLADVGCGAVDNWTGIVALAHLYRTIRTFQLEKNVVFVAFGAEERGLIGSRAMADAIPRDRRSAYCAMVNLDSLGLATPLALDIISSSSLIRLTREMAEAMSIPFSSLSLLHATSDSSAFLDRGIPAITLSALSNEWESILHRPADQPEKVLPGSVYLGYRLALAVWEGIENAPCDAFR